MKTTFTLFLIMLLMMRINSAKAQDNSVADAFTQSYYFEKVVNYTSAVASIKKVYDPNSYEINLRLGWLTYNAGLYKESMNYYQVAINLMPVSIEARMGYVNPAAAFGNMNQVMEQYTKILEINPQHSIANYRMGYIYYDKKDYPTAYKYFEKVVNLYPFTYDGLLMFAWTNSQLGKTREAQVLFNKVLLLSPGDKSAMEGLSLIK